jgi:transcriptional regulator with XRE-family HTH domain
MGQSAMETISPLQLNVQQNLKNIWPNAIQTGQSMSANASQIFTISILSHSPENPLAKRVDWQDTESRQAYMEACVEQDVAWQISINRKARGLTQKQLAEKVGTTQTSITRWEDPCYGRHSIGALVKIAHAFDCALLVRLIPYSKLAEISQDTSPSAFMSPSYESEIKEIKPC